MEKCRRRWDLADAEQLKYRFMQVATPPPPNNGPAAWHAVPWCCQPRAPHHRALHLYACLSRPCAMPRGCSLPSVQRAPPPPPASAGLRTQAFERGMQHLDKAYGFLASPHEYISRKARLLGLPPCVGSHTPVRRAARRPPCPVHGALRQGHDPQDPACRRQVSTSMARTPSCACSVVAPQDDGARLSWLSGAA